MPADGRRYRERGVVSERDVAADHEDSRGLRRVHRMDAAVDLGKIKRVRQDGRRPREKHRGVDRERVWFEGASDIVTCTPDTLSKFLDAVHRRGVMPVRKIVVDESQFFKNATASRTAALHALAEHVPTWLLSGTPTPNGTIDCWSPGRILSQQGGFWQ